MNNISSAYIKGLSAALFTMGLSCAPGVFGQNCNVNNITITTPSSDFQIEKTGVATHTKTGLMWMRCSLGQTWDGITCVGLAGNYSWQQALNIQRGFSFAGYNDWRVPNKNELASILENNCERPAINLEVFPRTPSAYYWTSTPFAALTNLAWSIHFNNSFVYYELKSGQIHVRLVRGG